MNQPRRILAGTEPPGGATCLFPVVEELRRRADVEVELVGRRHAADVFRDYGVEFVDPADATGQEIVARFEPDLIMTGVVGPIDEGLDYHLLRTARDLRIPSLGILDAWMNYASRFADPDTGDPLGYLPDRLAVMDGRTVEELVAEGIPRDRLHVTGHPFLHVVRRRAEDRAGISRVRKGLGLASADRVIAFFSEPLRWGEQEGLNESAGYDEFAAFGLLEAAVARCPEGSVLIVQEHPRRATLDLPHWIGSTPVVRNGELTALDVVQVADVVVGMSSTMLAWAYLMGRKVLAIQPGLLKELDRNMLTRRGILPNLETCGEVLRALEVPADTNREMLRAVRRDLGWTGWPEVLAAECALEMCAETVAGRL